MNGGAAGFAGYIYQPHYMAYRFLSSEAGRLLIDDVASCVARFSVEGQLHEGDPVWDILLTLENGTVQLLECKDTAITLKHRHDFYRRVRRQAANGTAADQLSIGWVTDPDKQDGILLDHFAEMSRLVDPGAAVDWHTCPTQVRSGQDALQEAMYFLCSDEASGSVPPISAPDAARLLKNLSCVKYRHSELAAAVEVLATGVFDSGTGDAIRKYILGDLSSEILRKGEAAYAREEFLAAIRTAPIAVAARGPLRAILCDYSGAAALRSPSIQITWKQLAGQPRKVWALDERLPSWDHTSSCVVVAQTGVGKTSTTWQAFEAQKTRLEPHHVLRVGASNLDEANVDALPRLCCILGGVSRCWLAIDGLDEIGSDEALRWRAALDVLLRTPNLVLMLTARQEVLAAYDWLQQLVSGLPAVTLPLLDIDQVRAAFADVNLVAPTSASLLQCLRNSFLLSLYAEIVRADDLPLSTSGEVTAFQIIEQYWQRRVLAASHGLRAGEGEVLSASRKCAAIQVLADQTLRGTSPLRVPSGQTNAAAAEGVEILLREGVVIRHSTNTVLWSHDWLREYVVVDSLIGQISEPSADRLARAVVAIPDDSARRVGARAAVKYILAHPEWGPIEDYLVAVHRDRGPLVSEAWPILIEGAPALLQLACLPVGLVVEAVEIAIQLRAQQWAEVIRQLPDVLLEGEQGKGLYDAIVRFELEVMLGGDQYEIVRRLIGQDTLLRVKGQGRHVGSLRRIVDAIAKGSLFDDEAIRRWLVDIATTNDWSVAHGLLSMVPAIAAQGYAVESLDIFKAILALVTGQPVDPATPPLRSKHIQHLPGFERALASPGLVSKHPSSWGAFLIDFQSALLLDDQRAGWPSHIDLLSRLHEKTGTPFERPATFQPNYDDSPDHWHYLYQHSRHDLRHVVAGAIEEGLKEAAGFDRPDVFSSLTKRLVDSRWGLALCQPLVALYDALKIPAPRHAWHLDVTMELLQAGIVNQYTATHNWRRLLRRKILPDIGPEQVSSLIDAVRTHAANQHIRVNELSDFSGFGLLAPQEAQELEEARQKQELYEPYDPRDMAVHTPSWTRPTKEETAPDTGWPHAGDQPHLAALAADDKLSPTPSLDQLTQWLASKTEALKTLLLRPESRSDEWFGAISGWCETVVKHTRSLAYLREQIPRRTTLEQDRFIPYLEEYCPWWQQWAGECVRRLGLETPVDHRERETKRLGWSSDDPIYVSVSFLDELLAVGLGNPLDGIRNNLGAMVEGRWDEWPAFTKATVLAVLRFYHWETIDVLRTVRARAIQEDSDTEVVELALDYLLRSGSSSIPSSLRVVWERIESLSDPSTIAKLIGSILGDATIRFRAGADVWPGLEQLTEWCEELRSQRAEKAAIRSSLLEGVAFGAKDCLGRLGPSSTELGSAWLPLARWVVIESLEAAAGTDERSLVLRAVMCVLKMDWPDSERRRLYDDLGDVFEWIIQEGAIGSFCSLHFDLEKECKKESVAEQDKGSCLRPIAPSDALLLRLCRASAERVAGWRRRGETTNDLGYGFGLSGRQTADLIALVFQNAKDREYVRRELPPIIDVLATAGLTQLATELRLKIRH